MNDTFGMIGGVYSALGWNFDKDEEILVEDAYQLLLDYNPTSTEVAVDYSLEGLE